MQGILKTNRYYCLLRTFWAILLVVIRSMKLSAKPVESEIRQFVGNDTPLLAQNPLMIKAKKAPRIPGIA